MKELIIDKKTNITRIQNKEEYTSLVIKTKVNPKKLEGFKNVKELTIDYISKENNYNELNINKLSFKDNIEKLIFKNVNVYGSFSSLNKKDYNLELPNLKSITFPNYIRRYNHYYLENANELEEVIFDANYSNVISIIDVIYLFSKKFKRIIIKYKNEEYIIKPPYLIGYIDDIDLEDNIITLEYSPDDSDIESVVEINTNNNKIEDTNTLYISDSGEKLVIPDYITEINGYRKSEVDTIIFNLNLLNHTYLFKEIISSTHYDKLRVIELKSNNEMSLFPSVKIYVKDYGVLEDLYLEKNLLYLEYRDKIITVNSKGEINKTIKNNIEEYENLEIDLKKYSLEELEEYVSFLKLLKLSEDTEYKNAMNIVEKTLIKKLTK